MTEKPFGTIGAGSAPDFAQQDKTGVFSALMGEPADVVRARELLKTFDEDPSRLSVNEQALANGIRRTEQAARDLARTIRDNTAQMIVSMAESNYARDISGELALMNWNGIARSLREIK